MPRRIKLFAIIKWLALFYLLICLLLWAFQRNLLYFPSHNVEPAAAYGLTDFHEILLAAKDGTQLTAWFHVASAGYPTVIYFHGNLGNISLYADYFKALSQTGFGILALDYRGFGNSGGSPSEKGFYQDGRALLNYAREGLGIAPKHIIIYGESIGTGVAVRMATQYKAAALVLQSPFTSVLQLKGDILPWFPMRWLLSDWFDSVGRITDVHMPLLMMHGEEDNSIPISYARLLFAQAHEPKRAIYFAHKGHMNLDPVARTQALLKFCIDNQLISVEDNIAPIR